MLTIKEQSEVYRLGLLIGFFTIEDVIHWTDFYILKEDKPDINIINLSLSGSKGKAEILLQLDELKGIMDKSIPTQTLLGLIYKKYIDSPSLEVTRILYTFTLDLAISVLSEKTINRLVTIDDTFEFIGEEIATFEIKELLEEYEPLADEFINITENIFY